MLSKIKVVSIIGGGSWGTTVGLVIAENHPDITIKIWAYEKTVVSSINNLHENVEFLPGVLLPANIIATNSLKEACKQADVLIMATPSKVVPDIAQKVDNYINENVTLGFLTKGFCKVHNQILTISQTLDRFMPKLKGKSVAISGPSHAEELSTKYHTCLNIGSKNITARKVFCHILTSPYLQCRENEDIIGVEVGGTLKNPAAIAAGIISILPGCGDNLEGALIAEAMKEMIRLGRYFKAKDETMVDISGLGDLVATSLSPHSRNRRFGQDIAHQILEKNNKLRLMDRILLYLNPKAVIEKMGETVNYLAEGAYAIEPLIELATKEDIPVPVYRSLYEVLLNKKDPTLLIETIKNPERFEELYRQTKIHIAEKRKGLENVQGKLFNQIMLSRVLDYCFTKKDGADVFVGNDKLIEKIQTYSSTLEKTKANEKEKNLVDSFALNPSKTNASALVQFYLKGLMDNYNGIIFKIFMFMIAVARIFSGSLFGSKRTFIEGNIPQLRACCEQGHVIYVLANRSFFDFILAIRNIFRIQLPIPRFMVTANSISSSFQSFFIRHAGGFIIDEKKYRNPIYREVFFAYISTMIENGVPLMLNRSYDTVTLPESLLQTIKKSMLNKSIEIMIAPMSIAYTNGSSLSKNSIFPLRNHLRGGMIHRFSDFIFLSEFSKEENQAASIFPHLEATFKSDKPLYPHVLLAKVFQENGYSIPKKNLGICTMTFIELEGIQLKGSPKKLIDEGIRGLRKKKIIRKVDKGYVVDDRNKLKRLADLY